MILRPMTSSAKFEVSAMFPLIRWVKTKIVVQKTEYDLSLLAFL